MALILLTFIAAFLLLSSLGVLIFYRQTALRRLSRVISRKSEDSLFREVVPVPGSKIEKIVKPFEKVVPRSPEEVSTVQKRLIRAGYRKKSYVNIFYSAKVLVPGLFCILATVTGVYTYGPFFVYALAAGLGFLAPDFWISNRIKARQLQSAVGSSGSLGSHRDLRGGWPELGSGNHAHLDGTKVSQPAIADELNLVVLEQRAGRPRAEAWKHIGERTDVDTIRSLASILIQADKFGTSVGKTLRSHSETLRTRRRQDAEERAAKTTVKLVFPLVLFIFPSLFVVVLGPSMIIMFEGFSKYLS